MRIYEKTISSLRKEFDDHRTRILNLLGTLEKTEVIRINSECAACVRGLSQYEECLKETYADLEALCRYLDIFASTVAIREEDHHEERPAH